MIDAYGQVFLFVSECQCIGTWYISRPGGHVLGGPFHFMIRSQSYVVLYIHTIEQVCTYVCTLITLLTIKSQLI